MITLIGFAGLYAFLMLCWVLYLAVMNLSAHKDFMGPVAKVHAYALLIIAYPVDFLLNVVIGTVLFLDRPRDMLFTGRLKRYHTTAAGTWRDAIATWICRNLLDPFAPDGRHC